MYFLSRAENAIRRSSVKALVAWLGSEFRARSVQREQFSSLNADK